MKDSLWRFIDWLALEHKIKYDGRRSTLAGVKSTLRVRESNLDTKYVYSFYSHCATYLIDCTDERQSWVLEGHWCSVLGDWLPLDLNSFIFSRLLSFLLFNLSFALPQLFCLYQTPTGIWPLLTRSAKIFETGWWKINCKYIFIIYIYSHHVQCCKSKSYLRKTRGFRVLMGGLDKGFAKSCFMAVSQIQRLRQWGFSATVSREGCGECAETDTGAFSCRLFAVCGL